MTARISTTSRFSQLYLDGNSISYGARAIVFTVDGGLDDGARYRVDFPVDGSDVTADHQDDWDVLIDIYNSSDGFRDVDGNSVSVEVGDSLVGSLENCARIFWHPFDPAGR